MKHFRPEIEVFHDEAAKVFAESGFTADELRTIDRSRFPLISQESIDRYAALPDQDKLDVWTHSASQGDLGISNVLYRSVQDELKAAIMRSSVYRKRE